MGGATRTVTDRPKALWLKLPTSYSWAWGPREPWEDRFAISQGQARTLKEDTEAEAVWRNQLNSDGVSLQWWLLAQGWAGCGQPLPHPPGFLQ